MRPRIKTPLGIWAACSALALSGPDPLPAADAFKFVEAPLDDPIFGLVDTEAYLPSEGRLHALVVFAQFADEPEAPPPAFADSLFDPSRAGSLTHFYQAMSFDQFRLSGTVLPRRYTAPRPARAYQAKDPKQRGRYGHFVADILHQVDADIDLGRYDNDGPDGRPNSGDDDGRVDYLFVLVRTAPPGFILRNATGIVGLGLEPDYQSQDPAAAGGTIGVSGGLAHGTVLQAGNFAQTAGVMAHEFGHSLGLPDLYDLTADRPQRDSAGIGRWGLMGHGALGWDGSDGPNPLCAWSREQLGWLGRQNRRLVILEQDQTGLAVFGLHQGGAVYKIPLMPEFIVSGSVYAEQYLLLEHRARQAHPYDRHLPAEGLLVWHIRSGFRDNSDEYKKLVDLICADGRYADAGYPVGKTADPATGGDNLDFWAHDASYRTAHGGNKGDATDVFDGERFRRMGPATNPSPPGQTHPAFNNLSLDIRRRGDRLELDVRLPRWSGTVTQRLRWLGEVRIDGDLTIAPEGTILLYSDTRVRFAPSDRLQTGYDPERCELMVEGALRINPFPLKRDHRGVRTEMPFNPVVFEAMAPQTDWGGIVPGLDANLGLPADAYVVQDAVFGLVESAEDLLGYGRATAVPEASGATPSFALLPNFPNPFDASTTLRYSLAVAAPVRLRIFNALGQPVRELIDGERPAGLQQVSWQGRGEDGRQVAAGLYLTHMEVPGRFASSRKMLRLDGAMSQVSGLDTALARQGGQWQQIQPRLLRPPATAFGLGDRPQAGPAGFTLGALWVNLQTASAPTAFASQTQRLAALLSTWDPAAEADSLRQSLGGLPTDRSQALTELQPALYSLAEASGDSAYVHFFFGQWHQTLKAAALGARALDQPLAALADPTAEAGTGRQFRDLLKTVDANASLLVDLEIVLGRLDAAPRQRRDLTALLAALEAIDARLLTH